MEFWLSVAKASKAGMTFRAWGFVRGHTQPFVDRNVSGLRRHCKNRISQVYPSRIWLNSCLDPWEGKTTPPHDLTGKSWRTSSQDVASGARNPLIGIRFLFRGMNVNAPIDEDTLTRTVLSS
ncbi:hypothetical protein TCAL_15864 [Tigriopus californicus]|uniref:Uncharacterized protein n=1 Tax=Tigriopus californicus TaxID=6832 RepID=A0A553NQN5_TIGCA|nr:hypothetical protein TCAL_15864 [Tigriopus californicus]